MALLADLIVAGKVSLPAWLAATSPPEATVRLRAVLRRELAAVPILRMDNVSEYYYAENDQEHWSIPRDFPNLAPPFPAFWVELRRPSRIVSREAGVVESVHLPPRWGFLFHAPPAAVAARADLRSPAGRAAARRHCESQLTLAGPELIEATRQRLRAGAELSALSPLEHTVAAALAVQAQMERGEWDALAALADRAEGGAVWRVAASLFLQSFEREEAVGPVCEWCLPVRPNGTVVAEGCAYTVPGYAELDRLGKAEEVQGLIESVANLLYPALLGICFLHCKNVTLAPGPEPPPALQKARVKRGRPPLVRYQVLQIEPLRQTLSRAGARGSGGLKAALRICRGHFKDYKEGAGLFGKHHGLYWWEHRMQAGAAAEVGYNVRAPRPKGLGEPESG